MEIERCRAAIFIFRAAIFIGILRLRIHSNEYLPKVDNKDFAVANRDVFVFGAHYVMWPCQESNFSLQVFCPMSSYSALVTHILFRNTSVLDRAAPPSHACVIGLKEQKKCGFIKGEHSISLLLYLWGTDDYRVLSYLESWKVNFVKLQRRRG